MRHLHGIVTSGQLEDAGITKDMLPRRPEYERLAKGHYALPGARRDFWFRGALAQSVAGDDARLTSDSALQALGAQDRAPGRIRLTVPEGRGSRRNDHADVRRSSHLPTHVVIRAGLRLVPPAYAITDLARHVNDSGVAFAISRCLALRHTSLAEIRAVLADRGQFPGSARARRVLDDFGEVESHSKRERALRRALLRLGRTPHPDQLVIRDPEGRPIRKADIPFPHIRLDVEVDGPHHLLPAQQVKDRAGDLKMRAIDWDVIRITTYDIDQSPDRMAQQVDQAIRARERLLRITA